MMSHKYRRKYRGQWRQHAPFDNFLDDTVPTTATAVVFITYGILVQHRMTKESAQNLAYIAEGGSKLEGLNFDYVIVY